MLGTWLEQAKKIAPDATARATNERNARLLITVWGTREAADGGLKDFYYMRWEKLFSELDKVVGSSTSVPSVNWYSIEEPWTKETKSYPTVPSENPVDVAKEIYNKYFKDAPVVDYCEPGGSFCPDSGQGYVEKIATTGADQNISISLTERPSTIFNLYDSQVIAVKQGGSFTVNITADTKPGFNGQPDYRYLKWTHKYIWIDWNGDKVFQDSENIEAIPFNGSSNEKCPHNKNYKRAIKCKTRRDTHAIQIHKCNSRSS